MMNRFLEEHSKEAFKTYLERLSALERSIKSGNESEIITTQNDVDLWLDRTKISLETLKNSVIGGRNGAS